MFPSGWKLFTLEDKPFQLCYWADLRSSRRIQLSSQPDFSQLQEQIMNLFLNIVTAVSIGMLVGTEFAVSAFINPILRKLDDQLQAQAIRLFAKNEGIIIGPVYKIHSRFGA